jgi:hypothetical protein
MSMTTPDLQRLHPHTLDELQGLTAALYAAGWQRVAEGDVAALRSSGAYPDYELANFRTARLEAPGARALNCGLALWRRRRDHAGRGASAPRIYDALSADCGSTQALAEEALNEAGDQAASRR